MKSLYKMCGIVGFVDFNKKSNLDILRNMTDALYHRGPDDSGYYFEERYNYQIGLGHRRLSILDLSLKGHQPMGLSKNCQVIYKDNELCRAEYILVYNGEVYNFQEIREELEKNGYKFESNSDTEVILKAYHKWGIDAVHKFNGMFAIAIYDKNKNELVLIRDRAGIKPLYYYYKDGIFMFASELKSFHKHPNFKKKMDYNGLASFFRYGYILAPYTIFENAKKLQAGHYMVFNLKNGKIDIKKYWDVFDYYNEQKLKISEEEAKEQLENILISSFKYRMIADVDVGVFLSGGYDSTAVAAILQNYGKGRLKTFTIGFNKENYDESKFARECAKILGTEHYEYIATEQDALDIIPILPKVYDEPFGDSSAIPTILVSKIAKEKVTVALSADGADEIFGGYNKHYKVPKLYRQFVKLKKYRKVLNKIRILFQNRLISRLNLLPNYDNKINKFYDMLNNSDLKNIFNRSNYYLTDDELKNLIQSNFVLNTNFELMDYVSDNNDDISKIMAVDYKTYMIDDILVKVDRATMSVSLEGREPFLDYRIIEYVAKLPIELKFKNSIPKYLLKQIVHKYVPKEIMDRPKRGFSIPINNWYENQLKIYMQGYLSEKAIKEVGILNYEKVRELINRYDKGETFLIKNIWFIFIFQQWAKKWLV